MPLKLGKSRKTVSENIAEFHHGPTYAKTKAKHGEAAANRQAVAVALAMRRKAIRRKGK